jgi:hypothetical protein
MFANESFVKHDVENNKELAHAVYSTQYRSRPSAARVAGPARSRERTSRPTR